MILFRLKQGASTTPANITDEPWMKEKT